MLHFIALTNHTRSDEVQNPLSHAVPKEFPSNAIEFLDTPMAAAVYRRDDFVDKERVSRNLESAFVQQNPTLMLPRPLQRVLT